LVAVLAHQAPPCSTAVNLLHCFCRSVQQCADRGSPALCLEEDEEPRGLGPAGGAVATRPSCREPPAFCQRARWSPRAILSHHPSWEPSLLGRAILVLASRAPDVPQAMVHSGHQRSAAVSCRGP
jgi:hypothetical protein